MREITQFEKDLRQLEAELKQLEAEYNMFFAGQVPKPPWQARSRVEALIRRYDRTHIQSYADRFRFQVLQTRYAVCADLWDRGLRAKEEGRPGPFFKPRPDAPPRVDQTPPADRILMVTTVTDPIKEIRKLEQLYEKLVEAGREAGEEAFPFHRFVQLVKAQVATFQRSGSREVAFRVAIKDGRVTFLARGLRGIDRSGNGT